MRTEFLFLTALGASVSACGSTPSDSSGQTTPLPCSVSAQCASAACTEGKCAVAGGGSGASPGASWTSNTLFNVPTPALAQTTSTWTTWVNHQAIFLPAGPGVTYPDGTVAVVFAVPPLLTMTSPAVQSHVVLVRPGVLEVHDVPGLVSAGAMTKRGLLALTWRPATTGGTYAIENLTSGKTELTVDESALACGNAYGQPGVLDAGGTTAMIGRVAIPGPRCAGLARYDGTNWSVMPTDGNAGGLLLGYPTQSGSVSVASVSPECALATPLPGFPATVTEFGLGALDETGMHAVAFLSGPGPALGRIDFPAMEVTSYRQDVFGSCSPPPEAWLVPVRASAGWLIPSFRKASSMTNDCTSVFIDFVDGTGAVASSQGSCPTATDSPFHVHSPFQTWVSVNGSDLSWMALQADAAGDVRLFVEQTIP